MIGRTIRFLGRARWLSGYLQKPYLAPWFLFIRRLKPQTSFAASYKGRPFQLRGCDFSALREVLHEDEYQFLLQPLQEIESPVVLDVGAHIGLFGMWVLGQNDKARVLSLEASPATYPVLERNIALSGMAAQWRGLHAAAWKNNDSIAFKASHDSLSNRVARDGGQQVPGVTLAQLAKKCADKYSAETIDIMKIDIEGAEEAFLCDGKGADDVLANIRYLVIELHNKYCDTARVRVLLEQHFPVIHNIGGRSSSKALLLCRKAD